MKSQELLTPVAGVVGVVAAVVVVACFEVTSGSGSPPPCRSFIFSGFSQTFSKLRLKLLTASFKLETFQMTKYLIIKYYKYIK